MVRAWGLMAVLGASLAAAQGPTVATRDLLGQWEGRIEPLPGQLPKNLSTRERKTLDEGRRLLASVRVFLRLGPGGACKLATKVVNGPMRTETAKWSIVGNVVKVDRPTPAVKGATRKGSLIGTFSPRDGKMTLELPSGSGRIKGRIVLVRTGLPATPPGP